MKKLFFLFSILLTGLLAKAQDDDKPKVYTRPNSDYAQDTIDPNRTVKSFQPKKKLDLSKFIIEPDVIFSIYTGGIAVGASPYFGYNVWNRLYVGAGFTYIYSGQSEITQVPSPGGGTYDLKVTLKSHTYGGGVFLQYNIWKGFFARAKFEVLQRSIKYPESYSILPSGPVVNYSNIERTYPGLFIGAGYNLLRSKNFFLPLMVSYNLLHNVGDKNYAPYRSGVVIQLGFISLF